MSYRLFWILIYMGLAAAVAVAQSSEDRIGKLRDDAFDSYRSGNYGSAAAQYRQALDICAEEGHPDPAQSAWLASDLAEMTRLLGNYDAAEKLQHQAIEFSRRVAPPDPNLPAYLSNLASLLWDLEQLDETERILREIRRIVRADDSMSAHLRATIDLNLGVVLRDQGRLDEARPLLLAARDTARTAVTDSLLLPYFLSEPAKLLAMQEDWPAALELWDEALALVPPSDRPRSIYRAQILLDMAAASAGQGDLDVALQAADDVVALRRFAYGEHHPEVGAALAAKARWLQLQEGAGSTAALEAADMAWSILAESPAAVVERATALAVRARALHAQGLNQQSLDDMKTAIALIEFLRPRRGAADIARISFLQEFQADYEELVAWHVDAGSTAAALVVANRLRARVLEERLGLDARRLHDDMDPEVLESLLARQHDARVHLSHLQRALDAASTGGGMAAPAAGTEQDHLRAELDQAWLAYQAAQAEIRLNSPAWQRLKNQGAAVSIDQARRAISQPGRLTLVYHMASAGSYVFVLADTDDPLRVLPLRIPDEEAAALGLPAGLDPSLLARLMSGAEQQKEEARRRGISGLSFVDKNAAGSPLDPVTRMDLLWRYLVPGSLKDQVLLASEVIVIPSGNLALLPFDALVVGPGPEYWLDAGPPVRTSPSLSVLARQASAHRKAPADDGQNILTVCNPDFGGLRDPDGLPWPGLPGTYRESLALQEAFATATVTSLSGGQATEPAVRENMPKATLIHLATHATAPADSPWLSGLVLAEDNSGDHDGVLRRHEIAELDLGRCELAVLSACQTAAARPVATEGVFALAQAFQVAGARATISALWAVDDDATAALMSSFFSARAEAHQGLPRVPTSRLLHEAKKAVRAQSQWASPYYWAAFVCDGGD